MGRTLSGSAMQLAIAALLLSACSDFRIVGLEPVDPPPQRPTDTGGTGDWPQDSGQPSDPQDSDDSDQSQDSDPPQDSDDPCAGAPRPPEPGELAISELMIDPTAVSDSEGEWVELRNNSVCQLQLDGCFLADEGVDSYAFVATSGNSLTVAPGDYIVICANPLQAENGGIDCQGDYLYQSYGGGFALSNADDEVLLLSSGGQVIDRFAYGDGFATTGASMGVDPAACDASANDSWQSWCAQRSAISGGDEGTPGRENDSCW